MNDDVENAAAECRSMIAHAYAMAEQLLSQIASMAEDLEDEEDVERALAALEILRRRHRN